MSTVRVLVVAGHDSSGRAGIDADREAARDYGLATVEVVTAWTEQEGDRLHAVRARPASAWCQEARAAVETGVAACKVGLLAGADHVRALAALLDLLAARRVPCVVDPVLSASSGEAFLEDDGIEALREVVLSRAVVLTPNVPEAARLAGAEVEHLAAHRSARLAAAESLLARGPTAVLLKGGHAAEDPVADLVLLRGCPPRWHEHPRVPGPGMRGSGCRYATAVACGLALGREVPEAATAAGSYLFQRLSE